MGNAQDIALFESTLTLDSSIAGDPISIVNAACIISFSRGPTTTGTACQAFQTNADPLFVNAAVGDFHLQPNSPMIDAGNPAAPLAGVLDLDGEPRALDATPTTCPELVRRRDIGADEFFAAQPNCPLATTQPLPIKKKCKKAKKPAKGRKSAKGKQGKCGKKKRRKPKR